MLNTGNSPDTVRERPESWRHSTPYKLVLVVLLMLLFAAIAYILRAPASKGAPWPNSAGEDTRAPLPSVAAGAVPTQKPLSTDTRGEVGPLGGVTQDSEIGGSNSGASGALRDRGDSERLQIDSLHERLREFAGDGPGTPVSDAQRDATNGATGLQRGSEALEELGSGRLEERYRVDLPAYDREAFAERQRQLEALRAQTLADLRAVSPADAEGMLDVIKRMSDGIRAQGLPDIIDMPKMEAMLLGSKRLNELNAALIKEMGRGEASRPEELARLAGEIQAVQATIPSTVYNLEVVGKLMRGELH